MKRFRLLSLLLLLPLLLASCSDSPAGHSPWHLKKDQCPPAPLDTVSYSEVERSLYTALSFVKTGTAGTCSAQGVDLRIAWTMKKEAGSEDVTLSADYYLDYAAPFSCPAGTEARVTYLNYDTTYSLPALSRTEGEDTYYITSAEMPLNLVTYAGTEQTLTAEVTLTEPRAVPLCDGTDVVTLAPGTLSLTARVRFPTVQDNLPASASVLGVTNVMQIPELPNGCEVTSLTIALNHRGIAIDKLTAADVYLPKNEDTYSSDFMKEYSGNPRNEHRALGCFAPVLVHCGTDILAEYDREGKWEMRELTGYSPEELYRQISLGTPVVVWITEDLNVRPEIIRAWMSEGGVPQFYPYPLHCVVLFGYNTEAQTVTIADPLVGVVTRSMPLFEARYLDLGSQAVIVTEKTAQ